jgi:Domain of unknown function DUF222.
MVIAGELLQRTTDPSVLGEAIVADRMDLRAALRGSVERIGREHSVLLATVRSVDKAELHRLEGCRTTTEYLAAVLGTSCYRTNKMVASARALENLPRIAAALANGSLHLDKVVELSRFATPETEERLIRWAKKTTVGRSSNRAAERDKEIEDATQLRRDRYFKGWLSFDKDSYHFEAVVPPEHGALVEEAINALAKELPDHPEHSLDGSVQMDQRRADAFVTLVTGTANGEAPHTMVLHAPLEALEGDDRRFTFGSALLDPATVHRLSCDARLSVVLESKEGNALGIGDTSRLVPHWLRRQVLYRDGGCCTFPGCEMKAYLVPHHIRWVARKGTTDLYNLIAVCGFHHDLVHEYGWNVMLDEHDRPVWFKPGGMRYEAGLPLPDPTTAPATPEPPSMAEVAGYSRIFEALRLLGRSPGSDPPSLN